MKQALIDILETFCPGKVYLQGTMNEAEAYPESFITFFTTSTENGKDFDNNTVEINWLFTVIYYSEDPALVNSKPAEIRAALKQAGFIPDGAGYDIPSDVPTHTGWAMEFSKIEIL